MKQDHLKEAIKSLGIWINESDSDRLLLAAKMDYESESLNSMEDIASILPMINTIFGKKYRVMSQKVVSKYKTVLKFFSIKDIETAMNNAKKNDFHTEQNYQHCTPEYFSRIDQIDKWLNASGTQQKNDFIMPRLNIKQ